MSEQRIATIYTNSYGRLLYFSWRRRTALIPSANIAVAYNNSYLYFVFYTGCQVTYRVDDYSHLIFLWVKAGSNIKYEGDGQWYGHHVRL